MLGRWRQSSGQVVFVRAEGDHAAAGARAWRAGTEAYVKEHNEMVKNAPPKDAGK